MLTQEMLNNVQPMYGFIWASPDGRWVTCSEQTTHTGHRIMGGLTTDINKAFVGNRLPKFTSRNEVPDSLNLIQLPATEQTVRVVRLTAQKVEQ